MIRCHKKTLGLIVALGFLSTSLLTTFAFAQSPTPAKAGLTNVVHHKTVKVDGLELFYREAGPKNAPTIVLLHGSPTSSQMFRNLIPKLADQYHVIAPDYPGFGQSSMPDRSDFEYTFDRLATIVDHFLEQLKVQLYVLYVQDYGAPVGFRVATAHPERVRGFVVQKPSRASPAWTGTTNKPTVVLAATHHGNTPHHDRSHRCNSNLHLIPFNSFFGA